MRICVLGHSTSAGGGLPDRSLAWPWLAALELSQSLDEPVDVRHIMFVPMGARSVDYAVAKVDECDPDVVIVSLASYVCAIRTVAERVRQRYGERALRLYRRLEHRFEAGTGNRQGARGEVNRRGRWLARRLIGTAAFTSVDEVSGIFSEVLRTLSQREGLHVLALAEPQWPAWVDRQNRGANRIFTTLCQSVHAVVEAHHLLWADSEPGFAATPHRNALYQSDGVHKSIAGHRLQATDVVQALIGPQGPFAERVKLSPTSTT